MSDNEFTNQELQPFRTWMSRNTDLQESSRKMYSKYVARLDKPLNPTEKPEETINKLEAIVTNSPVKAAFKKYIKFKKETTELDLDDRKTIDFVRQQLEDINIKDQSGVTKEEIIKKYLTVDQAKSFQKEANSLEKSRFQVFASTKNENAGRFWREFKLLPYFLLETALRINECLKLRTEDLDFTEGDVMVRYGKGNQVRKVNFNQTKEKIKKFVEDFNIEANIFAYDREKHYWKIRYEMLRIGTKLYDRKVTPHWFRHSFATNWAIKRIKEGEGRGNIKEEIQEYLGHSDQKTTEQYIHAAKELEKDNIFEKHGSFDLEI